MEVKGLFQYYTSLSVAMRKQCQSFPIYRIEPVKEVISITSISNNAGKCRSSDHVKNKFLLVIKLWHRPMEGRQNLLKSEGGRRFTTRKWAGLHSALKRSTSRGDLWHGKEDFRMYKKRLIIDNFLDNCGFLFVSEQFLLSTKFLSVSTFITA